MDLTSPGFVTTVQVLCAVVFIAAIVLWPGKGRWRKSWGVVGTVAARLGAALLIVTASLTAAAVTVNSMFGIVSTWADAGALLQVEDNPTLPEPGVSDIGGGLTTYGVQGPISKYFGSVNVWLPPGYTAKHKRDYPVIMALHGWPGTPDTITQVFNLESYAYQAARQHKMKMPIIVMPQWGKNGWDTECTNFDKDRQIETWLAKDIPGWVKAKFPGAATGPESWATWGYSAGAFCSRMLAMLHPATFGADIDLSGYSYPIFATQFTPFQPNSPEGQRYDLMRLAQIDPPATSLYLVTDPKDTMSGPNTQQLAKLGKDKFKTTLILGTGGHSPALWRAHVTPAFEWLGKTLKGFKP